MNITNKNGKVYIVGAGPGDCGLLTCKGLEKLKEADVVVYDRLVNYNLLSCCKKDCEKIFAGKESGHHLMEQDIITALLLDRSKSGLNVVRLKGGNPFVFGRGSEEAIELKKAGIDYEIIPGITSGLAAPIYSGIPVTHRGLVTQTIFVTAHECPDKPGSQVEWNKLAQLKNTCLIIYMGASRIEAICKKLIESGMDPAMPAAVIENGSLPEQRTITARLDKIHIEFERNNFHAPVIIMISPAVKLRDKISWFEKKKLFNRRVVITGDINNNQELYNKISSLGADVINLPLVKCSLKNSISNLHELFFNQNVGWILFSGVNEVNIFFELLKKEKYDSRIFADKKIASVGKETEKALQNIGLVPDFSYEKYNVEFTLNYLKNYQLNGNNLLWIKDCTYNDTFNEEEKRFGKKLQTLDLFEYSPNKPDDELIQKIKEKSADIFIFSSQQSVAYFIKTFDNYSASILNRGNSIVIDQSSKNLLLAEKVHNVFISPESSVEGICCKVQDLF